MAFISLLVMSVLYMAIEAYIQVYMFNQEMFPGESYAVVRDKQSLEHLVLNNPDLLFIVWSVECDHVHVSSVYWERILELFENIANTHVYLCWNEIDPQDYLSVLPQRSVFISTGAQAEYNVCDLYVRRALAGWRAPVLIHFDSVQEIAWHTYPRAEEAADNQNASRYVRSAVRCTHYDVPRAYTAYPLVIRAFYARNLFVDSAIATSTVGGTAISAVHWWSLGTVYQRRYRRLKNAGELVVLPAAQRRHWCTFTGRVSYPDPSAYLHDREIALLEMTRRRTGREAEQLRHNGCTDATSSAVGDRSCVAIGEWSGEERPTYDEYIELLGQSVFSPCPLGSNPETYRHYEAMEMGSIPLMVKIDAYCAGSSACAERMEEGNFTRLWTSYPGPLPFNSWGDALDYVETVDVAEVQRVQQAVTDWYSAFKLLELERLRGTLHTVLDVMSPPIS